jgi:hypothetical protein
MEQLDGLRKSFFEPQPQTDNAPRCDECSELLDDDESIADGAYRYCLPCVRIVAPEVYAEYLLAEEVTE